MYNCYRYGELLASETAANSKLELLDEENDRLRKQIKEITSEKNNLIIERQGLQTQCRTAIMKWDEIEKELHRVRNDRDQFKKGLSQAMTDNLKVNTVCHILLVYCGNFCFTHYPKYHDRYETNP